MQIHAISNYYQKANLRNNNQNFNGHWVKTRTFATYPHEDIMVDVMQYVPDENETIPEIQKNFALRAGHTNIFNAHDIYTVGGTNFLIDETKSLEMRKTALTELAKYSINKGDYVSAAAHKLEIAKILRKQRLERDKFLTEEGIREIYESSNKTQRSKIFDMVMQYNQDMAFELQ